MKVVNRFRKAYSNFLSKAIGTVTNRNYKSFFCDLNEVIGRDSGDLIGYQIVPRIVISPLGKVSFKNSTS